jgi:hypothetical protein
VAFDIIPDHKAGFADAIVCHGLVQRESGMGRKLGIVAETCRTLPAAARSGMQPVAWHTCALSGLRPVGGRQPFN